MSKFDIRHEFECQNGISNVKNSIFGPNLNVKIGFRMSKCDIRPEFECRKTKSQKRKTKNKLISPLIEYRKTKNKPTSPCFSSEVNENHKLSPTGPSNSCPNQLKCQGHHRVLMSSSIAMTTSSFHSLINGKVKIVIYCCVTVDI